MYKAGKSTKHILALYVLKGHDLNFTLVSTGIKE